eukprot:TRINITY_DN7576_c0_g1_i1.p1 TRINITY_DN7576_c0_g1~~TRINITY_DN7576_c0_g1_i1.p1  ORF type:complete len:1581 (+),score=553.90 TRINITY_DN7576_c0_g1_i1:419-4744(+)
MRENIKTFTEKISYIYFLTNCFSSFEEPKIVENLFPICNLPMWLSIDENLINHVLNDKNTPKKVSKQYEHVKNNSNQFKENDKKFMRTLIEDFIQDMKNYDLDKEDNDPSAMIYFERFLEFIIDLLSQIPTRRYFRFLVEALHLEEHIRLSPFSTSDDDSTYLFRKMFKMLNFYLNFEVNDFSGNPYTETQISAFHTAKVSYLQRVAFKNFPEKLRSLALSNVSSFDNRELLAKHIAKLDEEELQLLCVKLNIIGNTEKDLDNNLLKEIFISKYERRTSRIDAINTMPLYPTEEMFWDEKIIPDSFEYNGERPLALPKLNLQFLSLYDFLLRSFNLYRLESAYEIKADMEKVVSRLQPKLIDHVLSPNPVIRFHGWSSNALPIKEFTILYVSQPKLGQEKPGSIVANIKFSLKNFSGKIRKEWDDLRLYDVLYLLSINEPPVNQKGLNYGEKYGLQYARGCEVIEFRDERDRIIDNDAPDRLTNPIGDIRTLKVKLDSSQYHIDDLKKLDPSPYTTFNCLMKRKRKENNFKAVLQTMKTMINQVSDQTISIPDWFKDVFLGYGDPNNLKNELPKDTFINFNDTFLSREHLVHCFPNIEIKEENSFPQTQHHTYIKFSDKNQITVRYDEVPKLSKKIKTNKIPFTPTQVLSIKNCLSEGLTLIVGPPGSGKTDVCVQALSLIYKNYPNQRTLVVTHSNNALNQIFDKLAALDIDGKHMVRLGHGSSSLDTKGDFTKIGRVNLMLERRVSLLEQVSHLCESLAVSGDYGSTCEFAISFYKLYVYSAWEVFISKCREQHKDLKLPDPKNITINDIFQLHHVYNTEQIEKLTTGEWATENFPFRKFFGERTESISTLFKEIVDLFSEIEHLKVFEILRTSKERGNYIVSSQAKIVAMTCTHASLIRSKLIKECNFSFDNLVMEESAQVLELDTFIPLLLQKSELGQKKNLKRFVLIGDHNQLPPVVKNTAFQRYSRFDQSMFSRFVRLNVPSIILDTQGRSRPSLSKLFNWRYPVLKDLPNVSSDVFLKANAGLSFDYQLINVENFQGKGEVQPTPYFYQNLGEAEYVVSLYIWLRLRGYPASSITILTTYNGQKQLLRDVVKKRCLSNKNIGFPHKIATVDRFQGQQNDIILLSLVRTNNVGHIRDVRRLVVAMSRARLGLYVFCRKSLFENCLELANVFKYLNQRPSELHLVPSEQYPTQRHFEAKLDEKDQFIIKDVTHLGQIVYEEQVRQKMQPPQNFLSLTGNEVIDDDKNDVEMKDDEEDQQNTGAIIDEEYYSQNFQQNKPVEGSNQENQTIEQNKEEIGEKEEPPQQENIIVEKEEEPKQVKEEPRKVPKEEPKKVKEEIKTVAKEEPKKVEPPKKENFVPKKKVPQKDDDMEDESEESEESEKESEEGSGEESEEDDSPKKPKKSVKKPTKAVKPTKSSPKKKATKKKAAKKNSKK